MKVIIESFEIWTVSRGMNDSINKAMIDAVINGNRYSHMIESTEPITKACMLQHFVDDLLNVLDV